MRDWHWLYVSLIIMIACRISSVGSFRTSGLVVKGLRSFQSTLANGVHHSHSNAAASGFKNKKVHSGSPFARSMCSQLHTKPGSGQEDSTDGNGSDNDNTMSPGGTITTDTEENPGFKNKLKLLWSKYGVVTAVTYFSIYGSTLAGLYFSLEYDIFHASTLGFDPAQTVQGVCDTVERVTGNNALPEYIREYPKVGTFAIAWIITKFTEPVRLVTTVTIVPSISRFFGYSDINESEPNNSLLKKDTKST